MGKNPNVSVVVSGKNDFFLNFAGSLPKCHKSQYLRECQTPIFFLTASQKSKQKQMTFLLLVEHIPDGLLELLE
jgi:hypothetical protein